MTIRRELNIFSINERTRKNKKKWKERVEQMRVRD